MSFLSIPRNVLEKTYEQGLRYRYGQNYPSSFLCAELGIDTPDIQENEAAYLASWIKTLKEDDRAVVVAAGAAQRAADLILGREEKREETGEEEETVAVVAPKVEEREPVASTLWG